MLVFLAAAYTNYSSHIVDAEGIEPVDEFIGGSKAGKLILRFEKVEEENRGCLFCHPERLGLCKVLFDRRDFAFTATLEISLAFSNSLGD